MDVEELTRTLGVAASTQQRRDGWWTTLPLGDVRTMATVMREHEVRLATVTGVPASDGRLRLIYHWDVGAEILNVQTWVLDGHVATISDLIPASDWVERELGDYFALTFDGRPEMQPLMLSPGDAPGFFSRTCDLGRDVDPAVTARDARQSEGEKR